MTNLSKHLSDEELLRIRLECNDFLRAEILNTRENQPIENPVRLLENNGEAIRARVAPFENKHSMTGTQLSISVHK